ncbi:hypothetical protein ALQ33_200186 [Pseudomonas syringae pv. philadelphi]|uniref:Hint domain-containing protein n=2 Tax=Pseudomonas syringae group genomosp. 3 TaxID=251701 RepID=A0A3M3ZX45_9PSED|nr:hypothetical protein ALQ33_200186 [Pseudomonas syringae pv. philadelphi]
MTENGNVPDETTLKYLGTALAPMAGQYAAPTSSDVPTTQTERVYTPAETSTLLNQFAETNPARYADTSINSINFQGVYTGDLTYDYARFYDRNIAVSYDLGNTVSGGLSGTWQGTKAAISNTVSSAWSLLSSPVQSSEQLANGVMSLTKNPLASAWNSLEPAQSKEGLATAYQMQGNSEAAAAIRNQGNVEFGLNLVPVERVVSLGKLGTVAKTTDDFYIGRLLGEKGPCCFAAGTKVSTPSGDRAIESLKVGDVVWSKPEKGGKPFAAKILATHQRSDQPIYRLKLKSVRADGTAAGETLLVTPSHPFYVPAKRDFIPVINLKPGDLLQSLADGDSENTSSEVESLELYLPVGKTYNLSVDVGHTFYVGELKTWVHNTGPCDLPEGYFGAGGGGPSGFSGGKPTIVGDPYGPNAVAERSSVNRDYYGRENAADEFSAGLPDYATHSTAKSYQSMAPRDLNEQTLWSRVTENPSAGRDTKLAGDKDFPRSEGWRKMEVSHRLPRDPLKKPIFWREAGLERLYLLASISEEEAFSDLP